MHGAHGPVNGTVAEGVTGGTVHTKQSYDITGAGLIDFFHFIGMHPHQAANLDLFPCPGIKYEIAFFQHTLVGTDIG